MKKLIIAGLLFFLIATTFQSDNPPGWYQQQLPRNDVRVQDIYFIDSLKGWVAVRKATLDSAFIFQTTDGGNNWITQFGATLNILSLDFVNENIGYAVGSAPPGIVVKTTNGGNNWYTASVLQAYPMKDVEFVNHDTGWICGDNTIDGGIFRTNNGGINWIQQTDASSRPGRLFFLNADTGWMVSEQAGGRLFRTTNGGTNWNVQYTYSSSLQDVYFFDNLTGIMTAGVNMRTTDGGFNWLETNDGGLKISMGVDSVGWVGSNAVQRILITTNNGKSWGKQQISLTGTKVPAAVNTLIAWAGGSNGVAHTTDGGGPILNIHQISTEIPYGFVLYQNYPNPFNGSTIIRLSIIEKSNIKLTLYDIKGGLIKVLLSGNYTPGVYEYNFEATDLPSGVYFYSLQTEESFITKKMIFSK